MLADKFALEDVSKDGIKKKHVRHNKETSVKRRERRIRAELRTYNRIAKFSQAACSHHTSAGLLAQVFREFALRRQSPQQSQQPLHPQQPLQPMQSQPQRQLQLLVARSSSMSPPSQPRRLRAEAPAFVPRPCASPRRVPTPPPPPGGRIVPVQQGASQVQPIVAAPPAHPGALPQLAAVNDVCPRATGGPSQASDTAAAAAAAGTPDSGAGNGAAAHEFRLGDTVLTQRLCTPGMNGRRGIVIQWAQQEDGYAVQLQGGRTLSLRATNLLAVPAGFATGPHGEDLGAAAIATAPVCASATPSVAASTVAMQPFCRRNTWEPPPLWELFEQQESRPEDAQPSLQHPVSPGPKAASVSDDSHHSSVVSDEDVQFSAADAFDSSDVASDLDEVLLAQTIAEVCASPSPPVVKADETKVDLLKEDVVKNPVSIVVDEAPRTLSLCSTNLLAIPAAFATGHHGEDLGAAAFAPAPACGAPVPGGEPCGALGAPILGGGGRGDHPPPGSGVHGPGDGDVPCKGLRGAPLGAPEPGASQLQRQEASAVSKQFTHSGPPTALHPLPMSGKPPRPLSARTAGGNSWAEGRFLTP